MIKGTLRVGRPVGTAGLRRVPAGLCEAQRGLCTGAGKAADPRPRPLPSALPAAPVRSRSLSRCSTKGSSAKLAEAPVHGAPGRSRCGGWICGLVVPEACVRCQRRHHLRWLPALSHPASAPPPRLAQGPSLGGPPAPACHVSLHDCSVSLHVTQLRSEATAPGGSGPPATPSDVTLFISTVLCSRNRPGPMHHRGLALTYTGDRSGRPEGHLPFPRTLVGQGYRGS